MTADGRGYTTNGLYVQRDLPIRWLVEGNQINSCKNEIIVFGSLADLIEMAG